MNENPIFEQLKREALYAQQSFLTTQLCRIYGQAQMARQLGGITPEEFFEINEMTVYFMNTDKEYIRECNKQFFSSVACEVYEGMSEDVKGA